MQYNLLKKKEENEQMFLQISTEQGNLGFLNMKLKVKLINLH